MTFDGFLPISIMSDISFAMVAMTLAVGTA